MIDFSGANPVFFLTTSGLVSEFRSWDYPVAGIGASDRRINNCEHVLVVEWLSVSFGGGSRAEYVPCGQSYDVQ